MENWCLLFLCLQFYSVKWNSVLGNIAFVMRDFTSEMFHFISVITGYVQLPNNIFSYFNKK